MKATLILLGVASLVLAVSSFPKSGETAKSKDTCRLANLIPKDTVPPPDIEIDQDTHSISFKDPQPIPNVTATLNEEFISGTYSLRNGLVTGLSTLDQKVTFSRFTGRLNVNISIKHVRLTGDYEIIDGKANLTEIGPHTFHGSGPLNVSAAGVKASVGVNLKFTSQNTSIDKLNLNFTFDSAHIVAENLVVDGEPVDWSLINELLKPMFDALWPEAQEMVTQQIQDKINWLLEECTLQDLIDVIRPPQQQNPPPPALP